MESMKQVIGTLDEIIKNVEATIAANSKAAEESKTEEQAPTSSDAPASTEESGATKKREKKKKKPKSEPVAAVDPEVAQFLQCDLRVGRVSDVGFHPEADGLYVLQVSYGNDETKTVCAGLRKFVPEEEMKNRKVVTICNLKPRKLRGIASEAMILAGSVVSEGDGEKETVVPVAPPPAATEGSIVGYQGLEGERTVTEGKFVSGKTWDKVVPRLLVSAKQACYAGKPLVVGSDPVVCDLPDGAEIH